MCERDCCYKNFNVTTSVKLSKSAEAQKECKCQTNFYIKQQQLKQQQLQQMQSQQHTLTTTTTNANMHPQQQQQQQQQRIHHMQMSGQNNNNGSNISPTSSHTSNTNVTPSSSSSPAGSHYSSSDNGCSTASSSPTPSATSSKAPPSIGVNLRVTGQCSQGGRKYMEDYFSVAYQQSENAKDLEYAFIGIYDGHGGAEAAIFAKEHLMMEIINQKLFWSDSDKDVLRAIREGYIATHYAMWRAQENWPKTANGLPSTAGTTATVAFIRREKIYIGHVGDSGIVLGYQNENENFWRSKQLTTDHKPESIQERKRIIRSGGKVVVKSGVPRVVWNRPRHAGHRGPIRCDTIVDEIPFLAVARSLGDLWSYNASRNEFVVSPDPDVKVIKINPKTFRCLIFGTDGLWNVVSPQEATDTVFEKENINQQLQAQRGDSLAEGSNGQWTNPSKGLVEKALKTWSSKKMRADNTSVVTVILYPPGSSGDETPPPPPVATTNPPMAHNNALQYEQATMHADILAQQFRYNDIKTYHEIADKYLPPEEYRNFNYYQEDEDLLEAESEEQPEEDPLLLHHQQHTSYTIQANESTASTGESFWSAQTASEHLYAAHATRQDSTSWHWEDVCANVIDPTALPVGMAAVEVPVVERSSGLTTLVGVAEEDAEADEESSTDEEEEEDEVDEDIEGDNDEEDSVSDYETDDAEKNYDWGIVLSTKNKRNSKLNKLSALTHAQHAVELKTAATHLTNTTADTSYAHFIATAVDNANPAPTPLPPTYLNSFAESYNSLLSTQITSQETVNGNAVDAASPSSSNSNPASSSYQSLSGSSMHEILQEQQRYQQQCMSEEDGYSLTKLETRRATASGGGGVQTFKIFQQQQQEEHAATASYHTPIASLTNSTSGGGSGTTAEIWQQRFPSIAAAYARCLPHMTTSTPTPVTVKPLELDALLQQEREEEQQVALEQLERQRKLADALAGVSASSDDDDEPIIEEYLDEELEEIAKIAKIAVQINEISSSSADETSAGAKETTPKTPESMLIDADLAVPLSNTASDDVLPNERLERIEILQAKPDVVQVAAAVQAPIPHAVIKPAQQSPYAALYKSQASTTKRSLTRHKAAPAHQYPNIPNENQHLSITASSHALCTKRAYASSSSSTSTPNNGGSRSLSTSRSASTLDKRQLRSTAGTCIDYSKRTLRTRNSLAKDMKAKTTLASTLKRTAGTTSQFLRTTAVNLLGVAGANSSPSCSRSSSSIAVGSSNQNGNRKTTKPERLAAAAAAFSAAAAHTHAINLRSRQINGQLTATAKSAANNTSASSLHTPAYRRERRNLRSLAAASAASSKKESSSGPTNFSKSTRLQSSAGNALAAPPPSPKLINAVAAVAAATRARSLLAKTAAAMSAAAASLSTSSPSAAGVSGSSSAATAAGVYSKRLSLRSGASSAASAAAVCAALRSRATRKIKR